ncbi:MAG: hypothetical protein HYX52_01955, partial [Chloroflexi bacterium]|nr:hypothetical protein [Chloroflexota bacterium]
MAVGSAVIVAVALSLMLVRLRRSPPESASLWELTVYRGTIKGFADRVSAADGEQVRLFVTTPAAVFDIEIYRLGWYDQGTRAARLISRRRGISGRVQPAPQTDPATGLVSAANWSESTTIRVDGWQSGLYLLKLRAADGDQNYIPLVVRDDRRRHDYLFVHSANTDQAYNGWGGRSLYDFSSTGAATIAGDRRAVKVSFDRPYDGAGVGYSLLTWEMNMARWLESAGYDIGYVSDVDLNRDPGLATRSRAVLFAGHSEYWSKEMRDNLEAAVAGGVGLGLFTGDTRGGAVRSVDSPLGSGRVMVCYKDAGLDPIASVDPSRVTGRWYAPPLNRPTQALLGIGTNGEIRRSADWIVAGVNQEPELFAGTGFRGGDRVPYLIGYEYDGLWTAGSSGALPDGVSVLGQGQVIPTAAIAEMFDFAAQRTIAPGSRPAAGRFTARLDPGSTWSLYVELAGSGGRRYLHYQPGEDPPHVNPLDPSELIVPLGRAYGLPGWRTIERDLSADIRLFAGDPPRDLRVASVIVRGALTLGTVTFRGGEGEQATWSSSDTAGESDWTIVGGSGELEMAADAATGERLLTTRPSMPVRRIDEAHSVVVRRPGRGTVVAVGTMQWSWALDGYGRHTDASGQRTEVD